MNNVCAGCCLRPVVTRIAFGVIAAAVAIVPVAYLMRKCRKCALPVFNQNLVELPIQTQFGFPTILPHCTTLSMPQLTTIPVSSSAMQLALQRLPHRDWYQIRCVSDRALWFQVVRRLVGHSRYIYMHKTCRFVKYFFLC